MARTISLVSVMSEFEDMVQEELQNHERLSGTCMEYDTMGDTFNIPYFGSLDLESTNFSAGNIPVEDVLQRNVVLPQTNFQLKTVIGNGYATLFNFDVIQGHVRQHANARGRFNDKLKIDALVAADADFIVGNNNLITATGGFLVRNLTDARFKIVQNGGDDNQLSCWVSALNMPSFFNDADFKSWDQNADRPLMKGSLGHYGGVDIRTKGEANTDKLPSNVGVTESTSYVVDYNALAVGYNRRPVATVFDERDEDRVTVLSVATAGAIVTLPKAIVKTVVTIDIPVT